MPDGYVRKIGRAEDVDGIPLDVGVDYDTVTICGRRLNRVQCEDFAALFVTACWEAADNAVHMRMDEALSP